IEYDRKIAGLMAMVPEKHEGKALLVGYITDAIAALDEQIELLDARAERDRHIALQKARVDVSPEGKRLLDYEKKHEATYFATVRRLDVLQKRPGPAASPGKGQAKAPGWEPPVPPAPPQPMPQSPVAHEPPKVDTPGSPAANNGAGA